ncbi:putative integral membrane protein [Phaeomoniella chlamydospora]|uniref:Putative integral membrane protein n=1 Tax=Phaeomoniella chlamydospora TaxID=158046 RepID=A0A0G2ESJ2_PHACM|nr:putative integral membrane protein [Phaeomoniella chlamydospora]
MGAGAFLEPLVVVVLLFGGAWINRATDVTFSTRRTARWAQQEPLSDSEQDEAFLGSKSRSTSPSLLHSVEEPWRKREIGVLGFNKTVVSPNTAVFKNRLLSRLLRKLPFLVECWYWALIYWTYQLGRALTAVTLQEGTVDVARKHALQLIKLEQKLGVFLEIPIQKFFLQHPLLMQCINWLYSFIHIPGTIAFLVWLYYFTITRNRIGERQPGKPRGEVHGSPAGPELYEARRRTMAVCNLLAFVIFTLWPCMPPRLLSDKSVKGKTGELARSYGFVDTVHGKEGAGSVWTENRFCNQYANHFILDAVAGAMVCGLGWKGNAILLNLLPLEDYFLWLVRIHKPSTKIVDVREPEDDSDGEAEIGKGVLAQH